MFYTFQVDEISRVRSYRDRDGERRRRRETEAERDGDRDQQDRDQQRQRATERESSEGYREETEIDEYRKKNSKLKAKQRLMGIVVLRIEI